MIMEVYVTYESNGYGGSQVSKIFADKDDLRNYLIKELGLKENLSNEQLDRMINEHYEVHNIIDTD